MRILGAVTLAAGVVTVADPQPAAARHSWSFFNLHSAVPRGIFYPWGRPRYKSLKRHRRDTLPDRPDREEAQPADPRGPLLVMISLNDQRLTVHDGTGTIVARSRVSTGVPGHPTPTGVFSVIQKRRWHHSNIYSNAPMPYMQRITWSGIALHEGEVPNHPASHGCIRLPPQFARKLWTMTKVGARIIIAPDQLTPVELSHPSLLAFKPAAPTAPPPDGDAREPTAPEGEATVAEFRPAAGDTGTVEVIKTAAVDAAPDVAPADQRQKRAAASKRRAAERSGSVSVFVSGKTGKVYVRKGFAPVLQAPVTIERPDQPLGTHVFTALGAKADDGTLRFSAVSVPDDGASPQSAAEALDRISLPPEVMERISALTASGVSLVISDQGLGRETGRGTDFIVVTD